jgi:hypothetical protein
MEVESDFFLRLLSPLIFTLHIHHIDNQASPEQVAQLSQEIYTSELLYLFTVNLAKLEFEVLQ